MHNSIVLPVTDPGIPINLSPTLPQQLTDYKHMLLLRKLFRNPHSLLFAKSIPISRRKYLLKRWRDDRTKFILEFMRDYDYLNDAEMVELLSVVKIAKILTHSQKRMRINIQLIDKK
jgi:hypothetical protein